MRRHSRSQGPRLLLAALTVLAPAALAAVPPIVQVTQPLSFTLTQNGTTSTIQAVERAQSAASFYDYFSASSHTGFEAPWESKLFLYRDTTTGELSLFFTHNIDRDTSGIATGNGAVTLDLDGVPPGAYVAQSDDPPGGPGGPGGGIGELDLGTNPEGRWNYRDNTDGGVIGGLPSTTPWCITVTPLLFSNVDAWLYHFASGSSIDLDKTAPVTLCFEPPVEINVLDIDEGKDASLSGVFDDADAQDTHVAGWDFGDGTSAPALFSPGAGFTHHDVAPVFHFYGDDGEYIATLTVTDSGGLADSDIVRVRVANVAPTIGLAPFFTTSIGTLLNINADATDPGSDDLEFTWDFGDGSPTVSTMRFNDGTGPDPFPSPAGAFPFFAQVTQSHAWCAPGNYVLTLSVTDDDGGTSVRTATVQVLPTPVGDECNEPPICDAGSDRLASCDGVQLLATATDPDGDVLSFSWSSPCAGTIFLPLECHAAPVCVRAHVKQRVCTRRMRTS